MTAPRFALIDRDGTIIAHRHHLADPAEVELIPRAAEALRHLRDASVRVAVVTNQSVVGRGLVTPTTLDRIHQRMNDLLAAQGARVDAIRVCPHRPDDGCDCRKPRTGMALSLAREFGFSLREAFVVGDNTSDIALGRALCATTVLVRTGLGASVEARGGVECDHVADDLYAAARWIEGRL